MYFPIRWLALLSTLVATVHAAVEGVEVDLVFPRNETYSPSHDFPIIFAVQNSQRAELLNIVLRYQVRWGDSVDNYTWGWTDLTWANWSSADPYFAYRFSSLNWTESWRLDWQLYWQSCDEKVLANDNRGRAVLQNHDGRVWFTTDDSAPKDVDLHAVTTVATCPNYLNGIVINVTDTIMQSPLNVNRVGRDACVLTVNSTDSATSTTPDPCRVAIDEKAVASMAAARRKRQCNPLRESPNMPQDCLTENGALQRSVLAISSFLAAFGVLGFILL